MPSNSVYVFIKFSAYRRELLLTIIMKEGSALGCSQLFIEYDLRIVVSG
jgi:hypothetical protein